MRVGSLIPQEVADAILETCSKQDLSEIAEKEGKSLSTLRSLLYRQHQLSSNHEGLITSSFNRLVGKAEQLATEFEKKTNDYKRMQENSLKLFSESINQKSE